MRRALVLLLAGCASAPPPAVQSKPGSVRGEPAVAPAQEEASPAGVDRAAIKQGTGTIRGELETCYNQAFQANPALADVTVTVHFTIGTDGKVIESTADGSGAPDLDACVAAAMATVVFPAPRGGGLVRVNYPFRFRGSL